MSQKNQFTIKFGGDGNIRVETLTDFLDQYKQLFYLINAELGYSSEDLVIEVSPPTHGSFQIKIKSKYKDLILDKMGDLSVGVILGVIAIYTANKGDSLTIKDVEHIIEEKGLQGKDVPRIVNNVYHNSGARQNIRQTFIILNNDENVKNLKLENNERELISIPRKEFKKILDKEIFEEIEEVKTKEDFIQDEVYLVIKTIHFEGQAKWGFIFRGYPIKASIKDKAFLEKLNNESFRKGDVLKVVLFRKRNFDEDLNTFIVDQNSYEIVDVLDHQTSKQAKLDLK